MLRFQLQRQAVSILLWALTIGTLVGYQSWGSQSLYGPEALAGLRRTMGGNAAVVASSGPPELLDSIGGEVVFEIYSYVAVAVALMTMFVVTRATRVEEETGRAELLTSMPAGRHAALGTALACAAVASAAVAAAVLVAAVVTGLPWAGSILLAASVVGVGVVFAALTAVAVQLVDTAAGARGIVVAGVLLAYALRAVGDVTGNGVSFASPIGWGQQTLPFVSDRWWPLALPMLLGAALVAVAVTLAGRRDLGSGVIAHRRGRTSAASSLKSPLGLAIRLRRGLVLAWAATVFALGAAYGSFADSIDEFLADNPDIADFLPRGAESATDAYLATTLTLLAVLASAHGVVSVLRSAHEERDGLVDVVLTAPSGRARSLGAAAAVAFGGSAAVLAAGGLGEGLAYGWVRGDASRLPATVAAALSYLPAVSILVAAAVLAVGASRTWAAAAAWTLFAYSAIATVFGDSFRLPDWSTVASPFDHLPQVPLESTNVPSMAVGLAVAAFLTTIGVALFCRRDIGR